MGEKNGDHSVSRIREPVSPLVHNEGKTGTTIFTSQNREMELVKTEEGVEDPSTTEWEKNCSGRPIRRTYRRLYLGFDRVKDRERQTV